jgi:hypothetical protein
VYGKQKEPAVETLACSKSTVGPEFYCGWVRCRAAIALLLWVLFLPGLQGAQEWQEALAKMPLHTNARELNRTNCVETMLNAFNSNEVVKALVFMPGATDEFYLFRRARADLKSANPTLFDAVTALTNQTFIRATFRAPFLLLHTDEDPLQRDNQLKDQETAQRLSRQTRLPFIRCNDRDWDYLQPVLKRALKISLRPWRYSTGSWHFYRHSFAAWNVNGLEALELASFAGKSKFFLRRKEAQFEVDPRAYAPPKFDAHVH